MSDGSFFVGEVVELRADEPSEFAEGLEDLDRMRAAGEIGLPVAVLSSSSPRAPRWRRVYGALVAPIASPVPRPYLVHAPQMPEGPEPGEIVFAFDLDVARTRPEQLERLAAETAALLGIDAAEALELVRSGEVCGILAAEVFVPELGRCMASEL